MFIGDVVEGLAAVLLVAGSTVLVGGLVSWLAGVGVGLLVLGACLGYFAQVLADVPVRSADDTA